MKNLLIYNYSYTAESFMNSVSLYAKAKECKILSNDKILTFLNNNNFNGNIIFLDKDVYLAQYLENKGFNVLNSSKTIEIFDDKYKTYLAAENIIVQPETYSVPFTFNKKEPDYNFYEFIADKLSFPVVIKQNHGSLGEQVYLAENFEQLIKYSRNLIDIPHIFQKFISQSYGEDLRFFIFGKKCRGAVSRKNLKDFRSNVNFGGCLNMLDIKNYPEHLQKAELLSEKLNLSFGSVDFFANTKEPLLCEVNTSPMIFNYYKLTGINLADFINI